MKKEMIEKIAKKNKLKDGKVFVEFITRRFPNEFFEPYVEEWARRFKTGNPEYAMDSESRKIYFELKGNKLRDYRVVIPYYHEFYVKARDAKEALLLAHSKDGEILCWDDEAAEIEEVEV